MNASQRPTKGATHSGKLELANRLADLAVWRGVANFANPPRRGAYRRGVEALATLLRPRFESGELRGFTDDDAERTPHTGRPQTFKPPLWRIEKECSRTFIRTPEAALLVLRSASPRARKGTSTWSWDDPGSYSLRLAAEVLMARDVLFFARAQRWYTPAADEDPAPSKAELRRVA